MKTYTTTRGATVEILAIQTLLEKFEASARLPKVPEELADILGDAMPKPDAPTYDVKTLTGKVETYLHDETTVETDAEKAAWEKYRGELAQYEQVFGERRQHLVLLRGIADPKTHLPFALPSDDSWIDFQEQVLGVVVPTEPFKRLVHYIYTEIIGGVGDFTEIMRLCMTLALPEELRREADALFQREMGQYAAQRIGRAAQQMDGERTLRESGGSTEGAPVATEQV